MTLIVKRRLNELECSLLFSAHIKATVGNKSTRLVYSSILQEKLIEAILKAPRPIKLNVDNDEKTVRIAI